MTKKLYAKLGNGKKVLIKEYNSGNGSNHQLAQAAAAAAGVTMAAQSQQPASSSI